MVRRELPAPTTSTRAGLLVCVLAAVVPVAWIAGVGWLAFLAATITLAVAAAVAGADSREPGDWHRTGPSSRS
jgi:hypothetical protein